MLLSYPLLEVGRLIDIDTDITIIGTYLEKPKSIDYREKIIDVTILFAFFL